MKLIKKIAAIMFAFMMVFSLSTNVKADDTSGDSKTTTGTITIENSNAGQTYKLYRILNLESYNKTDKAYSYKLSTNWPNFITDDDGAKDYLQETNGYVTWKVEDNDTTKASFIKLALKYADSKGIAADYTLENNTNSAKNLTQDLPLGYYLVSSTTGTLCNLTTTNPIQKITDKNTVPTVEKEIMIDATNRANTNSANIGDTVNFHTVITVGRGPKSYVLHDKMDPGLNFEGNIMINANKTPHPTPSGETPSYTLVKDPGDGCAFHLVFNQKYLDKIDNTYTIDVLYSAKVTAEAPIKKGIVNDTWLTYGDSTYSTTHSKTNTFTFNMPVLKYTGDIANPKKLAGAKFTLYADNKCENAIELIKDGTQENYRKFINDEDNNANKTSEITTTGSGEFTISGLKEGTYYLKEIEAPKGYNKLTNSLVVVINKDGKITVNGTASDKVEVLNESGQLLPSTGGMGTTLIYLIGGALVLGSGIVLANKKRAKAK